MTAAGTDDGETVATKNALDWLNNRGEHADMLDHVSIQCRDVTASAAFYDAVLATIGGERIFEFGEGAVIGYGVPPMPDFWIGPQETGEGFRESHVAFTAPSRQAVDEFFRAAVAFGSDALYEPKVWPEYHPGYYGAFVRDPDGNNVEAGVDQQPIRGWRRLRPLPASERSGWPRVSRPCRTSLR